jgi:O-antigen ligase
VAGFLPIIIEEIFNAVGKDTTLTGRTLFWPMLFQKILERPWFGYGVSGFWQPWRGFDNPAIDVKLPYFVPDHAHNGLLELVLVLGLIGLALFLFSFAETIFIAISELLKAPKDLNILPLILLIFIALSSFSESGFSDLFGSTYLWFYYILCSSKLRLDLKEKFYKSEKMPKKYLQ